MYVAAALFSLAFLIIVHEAGHFFVARWCKMRVERFSIGFGPGILKRRSKSGTVFQIAPIPFGGFVEIRGMNIAEEVDPDDKFAYPNRPAWQRFVTIFAGPATNYLSAILLAILLFNCHGMRSPWRWYEVAHVKDGFDTKGKLEVGDRIIAVNDRPILAHGRYVAPDGTEYLADGLTARVNDLQDATPGYAPVPIKLTVVRKGQKLDVTITPNIVFRDLMRTVTDPVNVTKEYEENKKLKAADPIYVMGIQQRERWDVLDVGFGTALLEAFKYPVAQTKLIAGGLYDIVRGREEADPGGPKRIFDEFARAWALGPVTGIELLMLLSVYLGLFNLFPLPALDGGRLVFLTYELVTRRRANPKIEAMVHMAGIMLLGVVMILVTLNDFHLFD